MKWLITGGCGFVGSNLTHALIEDGEGVSVQDNLSRIGSWQNLEWLQQSHPKKFIFEANDVRDTESIRKVIKDFVRGLLLTAQAENTAGTIVDFGSGHGLAIESLASLIIGMVNDKKRSSIDLIKDTSRNEGQTANVDLAYRLTGWKPVWTLQQGLSETIAWYKNQPKKGRAQQK